MRRVPVAGSALHPGDSQVHLPGVPVVTVKISSASIVFVMVSVSGVAATVVRNNPEIPSANIFPSGAPVPGVR